MVLTLCRECLAVFLADQRYTVTELETDCCDCECFICKRRGRDYDIDKKPKRQGLA